MLDIHLYTRNLYLLNSVIFMADNYQKLQQELTKLTLKFLSSASYKLLLTNLFLFLLGLESTSEWYYVGAGRRKLSHLMT